MSQITEVTVTAGRTFNHPYEQYSNLRPEITLKVHVEPGEDAEKVVKDAQAKAEKIIEDHKRELLTAIEDLQRLSLARARASDLEQTLKRANEELDRIRKAQPELFDHTKQLSAINED